MDLIQYTQQTIKVITENQLQHAILVETEKANDALFYVTSCARAILKTSDLENHPDFFPLFPLGKMNIIKIESIRELIDRAQKTPNKRDRKVFAIFDAHRLNKNAANALLKILEEPPHNTILLLTTPSKNFLLPTITSRCALHHLPESSIEAWPPEWASWLNKLELFLQKLSDSSGVNVLEIFALLDELSKNMENFEKNNQEKNISLKDSIKEMERVLLQAMIEKIWNIFSQKSPNHFIEKLIKTIPKSSLILTVNGSFIHTIESIFLQLYQISVIKTLTNFLKS